MWTLILSVLSIVFLSGSDVKAQASASDFGNGGRHTIQGRLYVSSGRRSQVSGLKIRLNSSSAGDASIISDESGTFAFRGLSAGSYTITIEGGEHYEPHVETVFIDDPGSSNIRTPTRIGAIPRVVNVQVYLKQKNTGEHHLPPRVISAKWATVSKEAVESFERGLDLMSENKDREAEAAFRRSIELAPSFAPAHTALGRVLQRTGHLDTAIEAWKAAVRYDVGDFDAHVNLGIAYVNVTRYAEAETHLVQAAFLQPTAVTPHYYIGIVYVMKNDLDVAVKAFEKAKELNGGKSLPAIHKYLGRIYGTRNKPKEAVHELETYLKLAPNASDVDKVRKDISDLRSKHN